MQLYGLIGWPLGHSFSKKYFSEKFEREGIPDADFDLFPIEKVSDLPALLRQNPALRGLSVTIPFKETVIPFLHDLDETARSMGAVNCIKILDNQRLIGYNTDSIGFEQSLLRTDWALKGSNALILGTGGASKAVAYVLQKLGIPFQFVSRNPKKENEITYTTLNTYHLTLLINCTPIGTFPRTDEMPPIPAELFRPGMFVYDLIYNPAETLLLQEAKSRGCFVKNGLEMLQLQAEAAWEIWQRDGYVNRQP